MTSLLGRSRKPDLTVHRHGKIDITARTAKTLGLRKGDVVDIVEDGGEYYLTVRHRAEDTVGRHEGVVSPTNPRCLRHHNFRCYSRKLAKAVMEICGADGRDSLRLMTGEEVEIDGRKAVCVIMRS